MNCDDFKGIVTELAGRKLIASEVRQDAMAHAAVCASCAALLCDAEDVHAALRLAAAAETEEAPAQIKQALLGAFDVKLYEEEVRFVEECYKAHVPQEYQ